MPLELVLGPSRLVEIVVAPVTEWVDALGDRMTVVHEQDPAGLESGCDPSCPGVEVVEPVKYAAAGVDDVETSTMQLEGKLVDVGMDVRDVGARSRATSSASVEMSVAVTSAPSSTSWAVDSPVAHWR